MIGRRPVQRVLVRMMLTLARAGRRASGLAVLAALLGASLAAAAPEPEWRRFLAAERALEIGDRETFEQLAAGLEGYALHPYLMLADLRARLDEVPAGEVLAFIRRHQGTAPGERLRLDWLKRLAHEQRWAEYVDAYADNGSETRECLYRRALLETGDPEAAFAGLDALYRTGRSLPDACDPLLAGWADAGGLTPALVWQRIDLALARGNTGVAAYQGRYLPSPQQRWLERQIALHRSPVLVLTEPPEPAQVGDGHRRGAIIAHALQRLARRDPNAAADALDRFERDGELTPSQVEDIRVAVGAALASAGDPAGLAHLGLLEARPDNVDLQHRRLRAALVLTAWSALAEWAAELPAAQQDDGEWSYWRGRALARLGDLPRAAHALMDAAQRRSLWGFLAADLLGRPPALDHRPAPVSPGGLEVLLGSDTVARIRELRRLGRDTDVRREWRELTRGLTAEGLMTAAVAAQRLGLANEAILTLARSEYWDDIALRFPLEYRGLVDTAAAEHDLPLDWVYAVIRQESAFDADIASHADAIGLMQLLPSTARDVAGWLGLPPPQRLDLIDPALNLRLGSAYLAAMRERHDGQTLPATAAYNAGPNAVRRWLPEAPMPGDLWLTRIPYGETRDYVRRVLTYRVIYRDRLGLPPLRLRALLRPVVAPGSQGPGSGG
jgi:soluble lytic murein transglycosylase